MKRYFFALVCFCFSFGIEAQNKQYMISANKFLAKGYKYRKDIDKKILDMTKRWPSKVGILHSDWIENQNGKSIDLQGNEMFSQYDYTGLEQYCDSFFVMTVNGRKGVVSKSGNQIIGFDYWGFDFSYVNQGVILATCNAIGTGGVDVYNLLGIRLCKLDKYSFFMSIYHSEYNHQEIVYSDGDNLRHTKLFYPDGEMVCPNHFENGFVMDGRDSVAHHFNDTIVKVPVLNKEKQHVVMDIKDEKEIREQDQKDYDNNTWIVQFQRLYDAKMYKEASYCLDYYNLYERKSLRSVYSMPNYNLYFNNLKCHYEIGDYELIMNAIKGKDPNYIAPKGMQFSPRDNQLKPVLKSLYSKEDNNEIDGMVTCLNDIYQNSIKAYNELELRRQRNAQVWGAVLEGVATGMVKGIASGSSSTGSAVSRPSNSYSVSSGANQSSSSSNGSAANNSGELVTVEKHIPCRLCDGTGVCKICKGTGKGVYGGKVSRCGACDGHPKCSSCKGTGYKITYENVRK